MKTAPIVSVIIPIYNRADLLHLSLESVLRQTVEEIEILVIDDHSTDPLDDLITRYGDSRIQLIRLATNGGVSRARNVGIQNSVAPFIALLDSDDRWHRNKLARQLDFMNEHPSLPLVHTEEIWIRNGKRINPCKHNKKTGGNIFYPSLHLCLISPSTVMLRSAAFQNYGLFDTALPVCEDYDMWLRIASKEEVGFISDPLIEKYGGHADQLSTAYPAMDRYRVQSMLKLLQAPHLTVFDKAEIHRVIVKKATILFQGAFKRGLAEAALYEQWMKDSMAGAATNGGFPP